MNWHCLPKMWDTWLGCTFTRQIAELRDPPAHLVNPQRVARRPGSSGVSGLPVAGDVGPLAENTAEQPRGSLGGRRARRGEGWEDWGWRDMAELKLQRELVRVNMSFGFVSACLMVEWWCQSQRRRRREAKNRHRTGFATRGRNFKGRQRKGATDTDR